MSTNNILKRLKIHFRVLVHPKVNPIDMVNIASDYYRRHANISIDLVGGSIWLGDETPSEYKKIQIREKCKFEKDPTPAEKKLHSYTRNYKNDKVNNLEPVVYFIESTFPDEALGCTYRDPQLGSIIITKNADKYVLTHEIGHFLGPLLHPEDYHPPMEKVPNYLMNSDTYNFTKEPFLYKADIDLIRNSAYLTV